MSTTEMRRVMLADLDWYERRGWRAIRCIDTGRVKVDAFGDGGSGSEAIVVERDVAPETERPAMSHGERLAYAEGLQRACELLYEHVNGELARDRYLCDTQCVTTLANDLAVLGERMRMGCP